MKQLEQQSHPLRYSLVPVTPHKKPASKTTETLNYIEGVLNTTVVDYNIKIFWSELTDVNSNYHPATIVSVIFYNSFLLLSI